METLTLQERLLKIQTELKAPKNQYNKFGNYYYRNQEDILEAVKPLCAKYGLNLIITSETVEICGRPFINATVKVFGQQDEPVVEVSAQSVVDFTKKGMLLEQTTASATSFARKYALGGMFLIDDTKDADATNTHDKEVKEANVPAKKTNWLKDSGPDFDKVKEYLRGGGNISEVRKKYAISKKVEQLLNQ